MKKVEIRREYTSPSVEMVHIDSEISLIMSSVPVNPHEGANEDDEEGGQDNNFWKAN